MAVDRQALADLVTGGAAEITCDHPVMKTDQYRADLNCPQDIAGAKKLLADAGFPDGIELTVYPSSLEPNMDTNCRGCTATSCCGWDQSKYSSCTFRWLLE